MTRDYRRDQESRHFMFRFRKDMPPEEKRKAVEEIFEASLNLMENDGNISTWRKANDEEGMAGIHYFVTRHKVTVPLAIYCDEDESRIARNKRWQCPLTTEYVLDQNTSVEKPLEVIAHNVRQKADDYIDLVIKYESGVPTASRLRR
ncbi:MAG: hypothetical protein UU09_C0018G0006 [Microgenomates group bacterium GW2011_GWA2_40_6]|nr:MAG: hypothetical protein UU09_C0018G0006 [Microgenomates group bacterium GW2011_GWA2_40_6]